MVFKLKYKIKPLYIIIAVALVISLSYLVWHSLHRKEKSQGPRPVATMPAPVKPPEAKQDVLSEEPLHEIPVRPTVDISNIEGSEEKSQERPAFVQFESPKPFRFTPNPEQASAGTGYALPSNEHENEVYARV